MPHLAQARPAMLQVRGKGQARLDSGLAWLTVRVFRPDILTL